MKEGISYTTAELIYGTTLRISGEFFDDLKIDTTGDLANYVETLKLITQKGSPVPTRTQSRWSYQCQSRSYFMYTCVRQT